MRCPPKLGEIFCELVKRGYRYATDCQLAAHEVSALKLVAIDMVHGDETVADKRAETLDCFALDFGAVQDSSYSLCLHAGEVTLAGGHCLTCSAMLLRDSQFAGLRLATPN